MDTTKLVKTVSCCFIIGTVGVLLMVWLVVKIDDARIEQGKHAWTIPNAKEFVRLRPNDPTSHSALASAYADKAMIKAQLMECREAVRLGPMEPRLWYYLGNALLTNELRAEAREAWKKAMQLGGSSSWPSEESEKMLDKYQ